MSRTEPPQSTPKSDRRRRHRRPARKPSRVAPKNAENRRKDSGNPVMNSFSAQLDNYLYSKNRRSDGPLAPLRRHSFELGTLGILAALALTYLPFGAASEGETADAADVKEAENDVVEKIKQFGEKMKKGQLVLG